MVMQTLGFLGFGIYERDVRYTHTPSHILGKPTISL